MKKSLVKTISKSTAVIAFSLFLFSCGSAPKAESVPVDAPEIAETVEPEAETPAPETEAAPAEGTEEIQTPEEPAEESEFEEIKEEPVVEPVLELIEDIPCYYESDPKPVFLQPSEPAAKEEEKPAEVIAEEPKEEEKKTSESETAVVSVANNEEKAEAEKPAEKTETKVEVVPQPVSAPKETVAVIPAPAPEKKPEPVQEKKPAPAPEKKPQPAPKAEVEGIAAVEEVESSELLSESNEPSENQAEGKDENKIVVVPSRAVEMKNSQYLDIVYPGTGWIYLGEVDNKTNMRYFGRKIGERNTVFSLRSREEGNTILHFYKNDQLTGKFIDDYLQVEIKGNNNSPEHAVAPSYAEAVPPKPEKQILTQPKPLDVHETAELNYSRTEPVKPKSTAPSSSRKPVAKTAPAKTEAKKVPAPVPAAAPIEDPSDNGSKTVIQKKTSEVEHKAPAPKSENSYASEMESAEKTVPTVSKSSIQNTENMASDEILEKAKESFKNKKYEETLAYLDDFFAKATTKIDEGLMLQGQTFESNSSVRNIKSALDTYETIVRRYPQSIHWPKANERITYLRKFYFNIR